MNNVAVYPECGVALKNDLATPSFFLCSYHEYYLMFVVCAENWGGLIVRILTS